MMSNQLREELNQKRRMLHIIRMQLANYGMDAPVHLIIQEEDLEKEVRAIERELGISETPTLSERRASAPPRYQTAPEPERAFQQRMASRQADDRRGYIEHQMRLLSIHRRSLGILRAQARELGAYAPSHVHMQIASRRDEIAQIKSILRDFDQQVDDLPGDV